MNTSRWESIIREATLKNINPTETLVFLFGSRAEGTNILTSDFDIGLYQGTQIPLRTIAKIKDEIEQYPIPVDVDVVDFSLAPDTFKRIALQKIKVWNTPKKSLKLI